LQWFFGTFWAIFKMRFYRPHLKSGCIGLAIAVPVVGGLYAWNTVPMTLTAPRLPAGMQTPVLDGDPNDAVWKQARAVTVRTVKGTHNPQDHVDVTVKAVHDGERIYFRFQWADPDVSAKRFPLIKTAQGWQVLHTAMEPQPPSENVFYEDKLALYITDVRNGSCAATCHIGEGMPNAPKGIHYTAGEIGDLWHWKSVRTDPMGELTGEPGYMDDQYFGPRQPLPQDPTARYMGGYFPDPKTGGGYRENFVKLHKDKPLTETSVRPIMLPPVLETPPNPDPTTSEAGRRWWIHESQGIPYTEEADTYPIGTVIPDMLIAPLQGDRADVRAKGAWHQGVWTLEVSRVLDTKSKYDVALTTERPVYLSIATFNRTQIRHSEHLKPIRLVLAP
jgi:Ethylbenzene dehydrogenase